MGVDCDAVGYNPIKKVPVVVTGDQGCVNIDIVPPTLDEAGNVIEGIGDGGAGGRGVGGMASTTAGLAAQLLAVQSLASQIRRELQEMRANQMADRVATHKQVIHNDGQYKHQEDCIATRNEGSRGYIGEATGQ